MFSKESKIISNREELSNYISGFDVYNSKLLLLLKDPSIQKETYLITNYEFRPDLIARDYYGSSDYQGLLLLQSSIGLEDYRIGTILELIPKIKLDEILKNI